MQRFWMIALSMAFVTTLAHAQQAAQTEDVPVPADQWASRKITPPKKLHGEIEEYPVEAKLQQTDGLCLVSLTVGVRGNPQNVHIVHCTDPSFEETSLKAAEQYEFEPAMTQEGKPVPVMVRIFHEYHVVKYSLSLRMIINWPVIPDKRLNVDRRISKSEASREVSKPIRSAFIPQRGGPSGPGSDGVYPLTRSVTGPRVTTFSDRDYGRMAFVHEGNSACDVVLTIDAKGRASDPQVVHCERQELERPAVASLLKSQYKPGFVNGKAVPMRGSIHLQYGGNSAQ